MHSQEQALGLLTGYHSKQTKRYVNFSSTIEGKSNARVGMTEGGSVHRGKEDGVYLQKLAPEGSFLNNLLPCTTEFSSVIMR